MKFIVAASMFASAAAVDKPVISLDLDESMTIKKYSESVHPVHAAPLAKESVQYGVCTAGSPAADCKLPSAKAFDHHDGSGIKVKETYHLVNLDCQGMDKKEAAINFGRRSEYIIKYNAVDSSGNEAEGIVFSLVLDDPIPPVISYPEDQNVEACVDSSGETRQIFKIPAYSALDNIDGSVPVSTQITKNGKSVAAIDTHVLGKYVVKFTASDNAKCFGAGQKSNTISKSSTFTVVDTLAPKITLNSAPSTHECATKYTDAGAKCVDGHDSLVNGKLSSSVLAKNLSDNTNLGSVNTAKAGKFTVSYACSDLSGNKATASREITVTDTTKPVLTITHINAKHNIRGGYDIKYDFNSADIFKHINDDVIIHHATAFDEDTKYLAKLATDGYGYTCSDSCAASKPTVATTWYKKSGDSWVANNYDNTKAGTYKLDYKCTDAAGNSVSKTRTVINEDKTTIVEIDITFRHVDPTEDFIQKLIRLIFENVGYQLTREQIEVMDTRRLLGREDVQENLLKFIINDAAMVKKILDFLRGLDFSRMLAEVSPGSTPTTKPSVQTQSMSLPIIYITGGDLATFEASTTAKYTDVGATCSDKQDGIIYTNKPGTGSVAMAKPGDYTTSYECTDSDQQHAIGVQRYITVEDTTKPVCKLIGSAKVTHEAGFAYNDKGATCKDSLDGMVPTILSSNNVNHAKVGTYYVKYTAKDAAGNQANTVTREVVIVDTLRPVIGLKYENGPYFHVSDASDTAKLHDGSTVKNPAADYFA
jgi:hypothetical protein